MPNMGTVLKKMKYLLKYLHFRMYSRLLIMYSHVYIHPHFLHIGILSKVAKTEHSHPLGMVVSTHFRCGKGVKRGLKNGALPFNID